MKTEEFFKSEPTGEFVFGKSIKDVPKSGIAKAKSLLLSIISDQLIKHTELSITDYLKFNYSEEEKILSVKYY